MKKAPESYLNQRRPPVAEAIDLEGNMTISEALELLQRKGYYSPRPRPWKLGARDRGLGRHDWAILDCFGDLVAEVASRADAELIVFVVNNAKHVKQR